MPDPDLWWQAAAHARSPEVWADFVGCVLILSEKTLPLHLTTGRTWSITLT